MRGEVKFWRNLEIRYLKTSYSSTTEFNALNEGYPADRRKKKLNKKKKGKK